MKRLLPIFFMISLLMLTSLPVSAPVRADPGEDYAISAGHFYTQTNSDLADLEGYALTDDEGVLLFSQFQAMGGVDSLGYPISRRYPCDGFVCQAMQRAILQWRPELGAAVSVNVFDEMSEAGLDRWLLHEHQIPPPFDTAADSGLSWDEVSARHWAILDRDPAIREAYWAASDPLQLYGLPVSYAEFGPVSVVRAQRAAFQHWKINTPFATAGQVTLANGGDIAKEAGFIPSAALLPQEAPVAFLESTPIGPRLQVAPPSPQVAQVIREARGAVPQIITQQIGPRGETIVGVGSGVIFDQRGYVLTNNHVVEGAQSLLVKLPDGRQFRGTVVGTAVEDDLAVVRVPAQGLPTLALADSDGVQTGERVVGLGYGMVVPTEPNAKLGSVKGVSRVVPRVGEFLSFSVIQTDVPLHPGDSGGPLLNLQGEVVGLNVGRAISHQSQVEFYGLAIPSNQTHGLLVRLGLAD